MIVNRLHRVQLRHDIASLKPGAVRLDGRVFSFTEGWTIGDDFQHDAYRGEKAMLLDDPVSVANEFGSDIPMWIPSGDLVVVEEGAT